MKNSDKIILDLCGGTGSWSKPYADAGYDVRVITYPEFDIKDVGFDNTTNELVFRKPDYGKYPMRIKVESVYGILAAPPCTMFSMARTVAKTPRDLKGAMEVVDACLKVVRYCQYNGKRLAFWALENPKARLRWFLGIPKFTFNPYEFGDPHRKPTDIWGNFNIDLKRNVVQLNKTQRKQSQLSSRELPKLPEGYVVPSDMNKRSAARSITPQGFAQAFFKANR